MVLGLQAAAVIPSVAGQEGPCTLGQQHPQNAPRLWGSPSVSLPAAFVSLEHVGTLNNSLEELGLNDNGFLVQRRSGTRQISLESCSS